MEYKEVLAYLYQSLPMFQKIGPAALKPGLGNTLELLKRIDNPENKFPSVHIAGTNGKGSTSHMLAAVMQAAGYKTGLYTSPHLKEFTERIKINGEEVPQKFITEFVNASLQNIEEIKPSFFEVTVAMAFQYFAEQKVDIAIIETGLGGRLDSTNVIHPVVSVITNISYDHQNVLGDTLEKIAAEKAGIIKEGVPVVISETQDQNIREVFLTKARQSGSDIFFADQIFVPKPKGMHQDKFMVDVLNGNKEILPDLALDLTAKYQLKNLPGVLQCLQLLKSIGYKIPEQSVRSGLSQTTRLTGLKGRWQTIAVNPLTICDTGHNISGIQAVLEQIESLSFQKLWWVFGVVSDKDPLPVLRLLPKSSSYLFCQASVPRAMDAHELQRLGEKEGLKGYVVPNVNDALERARALAAPDDLILIGGSTFVVADLNEL